VRGMPCQVGDQRFQLVAVDVTAGEQQALPLPLEMGSGSNDCSIHFWPTAAVRSGRIRFLAGIRRCPGHACGVQPLRASGSPISPMPSGPPMRGLT
jgi:hypothetical protein